MTGRIDRWRLSTISAALLLAQTTVQAGGFAVPEASPTGIGASNALVADHTELGAIPYNAAVAAFQNENILGGGGLLINPNLSVTTATGEHDSQGRDFLLAPSLFGSYHVSDNTSLVFAISSPFGLETIWDETVFPALPVGHPTASNIELVDINPSVVYQLNQHFAVSVGVDYYYVLKIDFNADILSNEGDGDGWGWGASALYVEDNWSLGVSFHSEATTDIEGSSTGLGSTTPATAEIPLPWRLQAGLRYQFNPDWAVEADISRTGWSSFDTLTIINGSILSPVTSVNNWEDANAYRIGFTHRLSPKTRLRFGYTYDETPQPREFFSARVPDNNRHLFSIGASHELSKGMELDIGYMLVVFEDYTHNSSTPASITEPNGTAAYNGDYSSTVNLLGVGLTKRF